MGKKITILGHGEIGSALGKILEEKNGPVFYWDRDESRRTKGKTAKEIFNGSEAVFLCLPSKNLEPGLESIKAVLEPKETEYWFYLTDSDGTTHYSKTIEEHNENIRRYL